MDLPAGLLGRQQLDLGIDFLADQFTGARQPFVVHRLGGQLELAVALEVAGNPFLLHQRDDALHGTFIRLVIRPRPVGAEAGGERRVILGDAGTAMPTVAPRGFANHPARFQHRHAGPLQGQRTRRGQAGETAADDGDIDLPGQTAELSTGKGRCGIEPVRLIAHV